MGKTTYLVIAKMAGNFAMVGQTKDPTDTVQEVIRRASEKPGAVTLDESSPTPMIQPPGCPTHHSPMVLMPGKRGPFWSCHQKTDGQWCTYTLDAA